jgi:alpha-1,6-mannosyltransferase
MKFCDVTQFYSPLSGGVKRYVQEKIRYIETKRLNDRHILVIPGAKDEVVTRDQSRIYSIRSPLVSRMSRYRALLNLRALAAILEHERPDLIESSDPYQVGWKTAAIGRSLRVPVVAYYHSNFPEAYLRGPFRFLQGPAKEYVRSLYNRYEATLVPSIELVSLLRQWGVSNVRHANLGVNTEIFFPNHNDASGTRNSLGINPDQKLLLYVGRLAPEKNAETLFAAYEILSARRPRQFFLLVIGDGPQRKTLERLLRTNDEVKWIQYCTDPAELADFYRSADIFVHPGVLETFGLAALESQASGVPVIGIRGSRMDRIICHEQDSWPTENNPEALAAGIEKFSRENLERLGTIAAQTVAERYSWPTVFSELFSIYHDVIEQFNQR